MTPTTLRFADLNPVGRAIIVAVAVLTAGVAAVAFATSYGALYAFVRGTGLYSPRLAMLWPLLLDATFIVAQLAAILGGILRGSRGWPIVTMLLTGALTVWFNLQHAGSDPGRRLAAALPPVLMILAFETDLAIVKWVMRALGRPLDHPDVGAALVVPQLGPETQTRWRPSSELGQTDRWGSGAGGGVATTKRTHIEAVLERLGPEQVLELGPEGVAAELADQGVDTTPRYVRRVMDAHAAGLNGKGHP
jgi:uncharacterized protein DUF2637